MIASLKGLVLGLNPDNIVIEVGGVGLLVNVTTHIKSSLKIGQHIHLFTYLSVRENALELFGFETSEEKDFFSLLLGVNGVGPRLALAGLSTLNPDAIRRAVLTEQPEIFSQIPGVGKKTGQKILLHLQDKIKSVDGFDAVLSINEDDSQVLEALVTLGYSIIEAQSALQSIPKDDSKDVETKIRLALQYFSA